MKKYDYDLAKKIIEKLDGLGVLKEASIGMNSDWFWTGQTIWSEGKWEIELMDNKNADKLYDEFVEKRKNGLRMYLDEKDESGFYPFNPEWDKYNKCLIGGLRGSDWDTPVVQVELIDGSEKTFNCYVGGHDSDTFLENYANGILATSGCISSEVRKNRDSIKIENFKQ